MSLEASRLPSPAGKPAPFRQSLTCKGDLESPYHRQITRGNANKTGPRAPAAAAPLEQPAGGIRAELANVEARLVRWMVATVIATAAVTIGILRLLG